jgi:hypothetical protein
MIDKNYLKTISCFNFTEYQNSYKESIEFKANDNLNYCTLAPYQYYTIFPEISETISNTPWGTKSFLFSMKVLKCTDDRNNIIQIITVDSEWRRRQFSNSLETWWGEWINIDNTIDYILNNENIQINLTKTWNRYMITDGNNLKKRTWAGSIATIDEIIEQIKNGTAKIYKNNLI